MKKIIPILAALVMVLCMTVSSFAATMPSGGQLTTNETTLTLQKTLKAKNPTLTKIASPGMAWTYTVAPATSAEINDAVIDDGTNQAVVQPGPAQGLSITTQPSFTKNSDLVAASDYADNYANLVLTTNLSAFQQPGVYRYKLTDTTTAATYTAADVTDDTDNKVTFIDVFVIRNNAGNLEVSGYTHGTDLDENGTLEKALLEADIYDTVNLCVEKKVTGTMGDRSNQFPFAFTIDNDGRYYYVKKGSAPTASDTTTTATSQSTTLAHSEKYYIYGLADADTVIITETNNTRDTYKVSINGAQKTAVESGDDATSSTLVAKDNSSTDIIVENNLEEVSPTGIIMRYGPYVGMVIVALAFIFMRKKISKDAE